jgi:CHAT domain-containing protein
MCGKNYLLTALVMLCSLFSLSARSQEKETREIFYRIFYTKEVNSDSILAVVYAGKKQGIEVGLTGSVNSKYSSKQLNRSEKEVGFGSVIYASDTTAVIYVRPKEKYKIEVGDYVKLNVKIPKLPYRSIWFELACLDIDFQNLNRDKLYAFNDLLHTDGKKLEDSLLKASASDVFETWDYLKDNESFDSLKLPLKDGRYRGRSVADVMNKCTPKDVMAFLKFVKGYPGKYIGNSWKVNETFATWVLNNAPFSKEEVLDSISAYRKNPAALKLFITRYRKLLVDDEFVRSWIVDASNEADRGNHAKADYLMELVKLSLSYLNDDCSSGFYYYVKAQMLQDKSVFQSAIKMCDTAVLYFTKCKNYRYAVENLFKKAYCLRQLSKYDEALTVYDKASNILSDSSLNYEGEWNRLIAKLNRETGYTWDSKGEYLKAITYFAKAVTAFQSLNNYNGLKDAASVQLAMANIYKKQGEYTKAYEIYQDQLKNYRLLGDKKNEADVLDNIGYIESKRGNHRNSLNNHKAALSLHVWLEQYNDAGYSQSQIGQAVWSLGNYDSAIACHLKAIGYRKQANSFTGQAYSFSKLASLYSKVGKKNVALAAYDSTAYYYELAKDSAKLVENLLDVGDVYKEDKQYQKAYDYYSKAHAVNLKKGIKSSIADSYFKLAQASYYFDTAIARKNYQACYDISKQIGDKSNMLYSSLNLGLLSYRNYNYEQGEKHFNEGIQLSIQQKSKSDEAYAYTRIADGALQKLDFPKALSLYNAALHIYDSLGEKSQLPAIYSCIAYVYQAKGDFETGLSFYNKSKALAYDIKSMSDVGSALHSISFAYTLAGEQKKALSAADSALLLFQELKNNYQIGSSYITLGNVYNGLADYKRAVEYYMSADSVFIAEKDDLSRSTAKNNIGNVYFFQADYNKALSFFLESEKLYSRMKTVNESVLITKANIGETYYHQKDYAKATAVMMDVYKMSKEKNIARTLAGADLILGKIAYSTNKLDDAEKYLQEARNIATKSNESLKIIESSLYLGRVYAKKNDLQNSISQLKASINYSRKIESSQFLWEALYELGLSFYNQNNYDSAIATFKEAVKEIENTASKLFGGAEAQKVYSADEKKIDLYSKLVASLAKLNKTEEALFYADRGNNQAIKEKMEQSGIVTADKEKSEAIKKGGELLQKQTSIEQSLSKEKAKPSLERNDQLIASLEGIKKVAEEDYLNFINDLVTKYVDLSNYFKKTDPSEFRNFIDYIPDSTIVVLYVINDKQLYIFSVTNKETGIKIVDLPENLDATATRFLNIVKNPDNATGTGAITVRATIKDKNVIKGDFKKDATTLYKLLITPIEDQLKDKKSICIIPNSKLSSIPFSSIGYLDQSNQFHYLIEDYRLFYTNKMQIFSNPYKPQNIESSLVAFGNPDKTLPGASQEVINMQQTFPSATVYLEDNATEGKVKDAIKNYSFVHIATHGILDGSDFSKSYLLFNEDGSNDGKFTIAEMNGLLKKETSMVFLSACDMAVSQEAVKGWYISPINALLNNRVNTVVGPLWQVPDEATQILLTEFYKNIKYLKMSKTDALRFAQSTVSKNPKYSHPYFWAAFVLYGDWR